MACIIMSFQNMVSLHIFSSLSSTFVYIMCSLDLQGFSELEEMPSSLVLGTNCRPAIITEALSFLPVNTFTHTSFASLLATLLLLANYDFIVFLLIIHIIASGFFWSSLFLMHICPCSYWLYLWLKNLANSLKQSLQEKQ